METNVLIEEQLLFEEEIRLTKVQEYGFSWQKLVDKNTSIPPHGARFDIYFEGELKGDKINGTIKGVDYLEVRSDGLFSLDLHASIATADGANIKVTESGINDKGKLRLNMNFHTSDERYAWLNQALVWGVGSVAFETGEVEIKAYLI